MRQLTQKAKETDFTAWLDRMERRLLRCIIILAVLLTVSQTFLQFPSVRQLLTTTDGWEGIPYHPLPYR